MEPSYDVVVIGGGPAGLTAGLYLARARVPSLLVERGIVGGQITNAERVENYPGFPDGISGFDLGMLMHQQATAFSLETVFAEVTAVELDGEAKVVKTTEGDVRARAIIVASGAAARRLGVPGEERLTGRGVSYCATCDGPLFSGQVLAVVGGGDSAVEEALVLTRFASRVTIIHRRDQLRASRVLQERAFAEPRLEFMWDTVVEEIAGTDRVERIRVRNVKSGERGEVEVAAIFIYVGISPTTEYLKGLLALDEQGSIPTDASLETEVAGIFAAGDIRQGSPRQVITAAGDGATAALSAERYLHR
ncbi:MAG: thioredoxin-disulfide reductase [Chloroflexota bacterium]|nr:thioredoxin-disulfide reductase [Chloroflexota bacterium]